MSAIEAIFHSYKHIPTRKAFQIVLEVPEEATSDVFATLGYPTSDSSLYVGVTRLYPPEARGLSGAEFLNDFGGTNHASMHTESPDSSETSQEEGN